MSAVVVGLVGVGEVSCGRAFGEYGLHELPDPITSVNTIELSCEEEPVG